MIGEDDVRYVAKLARLHLDDAEAGRMTAELAKILTHIDKIAELDIRDVEPMAHVLDIVNVTRPDKARPSVPRDEALKNAPAVGDDSFRVPKMSGG
jgi:aspartyl-tRNA(Asn)/glutamyl-tRNA(Gln) amidotransferase subunit C